jgi:hypothetical protein
MGEQQKTCDKLLFNPFVPYLLRDGYKLITSELRIIH